MSVRIIYQDIATGADEDAAVTTPDASGFSDVSLLPFGGGGAPIAVLEPFSWLLDGTREVLEDQPIPFWSAAQSDINGVFEAPPEITFDFDERYTAPGLFLTFAPEVGEYCRSVTASWYRGITLLATAEFEPDAPEYFCGKTVESFDRVVLRLNATNYPYRYAKLRHVAFGVSREFRRDELRDVRVVEEVSILSSEVSVNTLDFTLDSKSDVEYMFQFKQPVSAFNGEQLIGVFYISDSTHRARGLYDVSCIDAIGVLDEDPFPAEMYSEYPAGALLEEIIGGHFELELDPVLANMPITGYMPPCTRREAMQQVAFALRAMVDTSGTEKIRFYRDRQDLPRRIPAGRVYSGGTVDTSAIVTAVQVTAHSYSTSGEGGDTVEVDGVTHYHSTSVVTINNPNVTANDKQNVVEVKDATLVSHMNAPAVAQHLYDYYTKRQTQRVRIVMDGEKPGDHVAVPTPWGTSVDGYITSMSIVLSGIAAADCEIVGVDVRRVGETEGIVSGEFDCGEV